MPKISLADAQTLELDDWGPVGVPVGDGPVAQLSGKVLESDEANGLECGVWECTPGTWRRQVTEAESCTFVAGEAIFHADSGEKLTLSPGVAVFFPANTTGVWEVKQTLRKVYMTAKPRGA